MLAMQPNTTIAKKDSQLLPLLEKVKDALKAGRGLIAAIDMEFNGKTAATLQLSINSLNLHVLFDPERLGPVASKAFKDAVLLHPRVLKVLHGSESLDVPYLRRRFLSGDPRDSRDSHAFLDTFADTRFLCAYLQQADPTFGKCNLYDGMHQLGVLTRPEYETLLKVEKRLGPMWMKKTSIDHMSADFVTYAMNDVYHLTEFYLVLCKRLKGDAELVIDATRFVFKQKLLAIGPVAIKDIARGTEADASMSVVLQRIANIDYFKATMRALLVVAARHPGDLERLRAANMIPPALFKHLQAGHRVQHR